ncbi:hypothetical protein B0H66DRAFT_386857 [Apodospora peruviana]|uniref:Uncharacterized protein n=1 Tax=Apodospora peruviana TaxID=516989 RepID=A0AAE0LZ67_9PEZI|nr:hypothetical protein B0H66DRAFT_386857 [Apodospora peruviana]
MLHWYGFRNESFLFDAFLQRFPTYSFHSYYATYKFGRFTCAPAISHGESFLLFSCQLTSTICFSLLSLYCIYPIPKNCPITSFIYFLKLRKSRIGWLVFITFWSEGGRPGRGWKGITWTGHGCERTAAWRKSYYTCLLYIRFFTFVCIHIMSRLHPWRQYHSFRQEAYTSSLYNISEASILSGNGII